jgi:PKD repeat protein
MGLAGVGIAACLLSAMPAVPASAAPAPAVAALVTTGVSADFEMNEAAGSTVMTDSSGNGNNGVVDPTGVETGTTFDGATGYNWVRRSPTDPPASPERVVVVDDDVALEAGDQEFTVELRYRTHESYGNIVQKGQATSPGGQWKIQNPGGRPSCLFQGSDDQVATRSTIDLSDNEWHTLTCVLTSTGVAMYVDGAFNSRTNGTIGTLDNNAPLTVGGKVNCDQITVTCDYFSGQIDYLKLTKGPRFDNQPPTAKFAWTCDRLDCSFDSTGTLDPDGTIDGYSWTFGDGGTSSSPNPPHTFAAPGTYQVKLIATDSDSATDSAVHTLSVVSGIPPTKPRMVSATAGDRSAAVEWKTPSDMGDGTLTGYEVTSSPGARTCQAAGLTCTVNGLDNGQAYTFTVVARSTVGQGPVSNPSNEVTPAGAPLAPGSVTVDAGDKKATVRWSAAPGNGSPVTSYVVTQSPGGATKSLGAAARSVLFTGLHNGTRYRFTVAAANAVGEGDDATSPVARPAGAPLRVDRPTAKASKKSAQLSWKAADSNGSKVLSYKIVTSKGQHKVVSGSARQLRFGGLKTGASYTFRIRAVNKVGSGPWSAWSRAVRVR